MFPVKADSSYGFISIEESLKIVYHGIYVFILVWDF